MNPNTGTTLIALGAGSYTGYELLGTGFICMAIGASLMAGLLWFMFKRQDIKQEAKQ